MSGIPLSPSNLRLFGAPPSIGRRECPREPLPLEGAAERSEAGLASFFAAKPPPLCLPHRGRGTASAVDRVFSQTAHLRRSFPLFFIPLVPYPARFARHLPHAGKALSVGDTAFPIQPPPLRGTSFHRKEGMTTRAPSLGRGCRAQRGGVGFRSRLKRNGKRRFLVSSSRAQPRDLFRFPFPFSFVMLSA